MAIEVREVSWNLKIVRIIDFYYRDCWRRISERTVYRAPLPNVGEEKRSFDTTKRTFSLEFGAVLLVYNERNLTCWQICVRGESSESHKTIECSHWPIGEGAIFARSMTRFSSWVERSAYVAIPSPSRGFVGDLESEFPVSWSRFWKNIDVDKTPFPAGRYR